MADYIVIVFLAFLVACATAGGLTDFLGFPRLLAWIVGIALGGLVVFLFARTKKSPDRGQGCATWVLFLGVILFWCVAIFFIGQGIVHRVIENGEIARQRTIVNEVRGLVESCRHAGDNVTVVGKVLVWDMRTDTRSGAYGMCPTSLQAKPTDTPITVFMVMGERNEQVGTYTISHQPAYRQYLEVAVASWPQKKPLGFHSVIIKEPRLTRPVQQVPEYGDPNEPIANWIKTLPTATQ